MRQGKRKIVYVGLSGGVDSAVSAGLLKAQNFNVVGVFIKIWSPEWINCTSKEDRLDAMRVCAKLRIPFKELDLSEKYKKEVVQNMIQEYKNGRTPNPDVLCNTKIKFGDFFDFAMKEGADFVATGHYSQILSCGKDFKLFKGKDNNKDQSYFLWGIKKEQLSKILFPIGNLEKPAVRKLAKKFGLSQAQKKDSQGLCFIGHLDIKDFLSQYIKKRQGLVINESGEEIGYHQGVEFLTIGERRGFVISKKTPQDKPYFIISKDLEKNILVVSNSLNLEQSQAFKKEVFFKQANWFDNSKFDKWIECKLRYRGPSFSCKVILNNDNRSEGKIIFKKKAMPVSGQSVVFYHKDECLGGGILI